MGQFLTIKRSLTCKDGGLISHFDEICEREAEINHTSLNHLFVNNHDIAATIGKKGNYLWNLNLEFVNFFRNLPSNWDFI